MGGAGPATTSGEASGLTPGDDVAVAVDPAVGAVLVGAAGGRVVVGPGAELGTTLGRIEAEIGPRWVWWSTDTARTFVEVGVRPARCWDLGAVHRLLVGGWRSGPERIWAARRGLDAASIPTSTPPDLFTERTDGADPIGPDGHLDPAWVEGGWAADHTTLDRWARLALDVHRWQRDALADERDIWGLTPDVTVRTARSESAAELLCAELEHDGLPIDVAEAERIIASFIGPRPANAVDELARTRERDRVVLDLAGVDDVDLRNPAGVKSLLRRVGIEVPDTRAWRLERRRGEHPVVDALLTWRRAERIATTFGYRWLDEHVGSDHRLRGTWSGSDGAAGRMTATAGLHNLPAELRPAVAAGPGRVLVGADLGQIEPRILAAVSGDRALMRAAEEDDMYAPVAARLGVSRAVAKVAVLGAMYGQTTGHGAVALAGLEAAYPTAMAYLATAARTAEGGRDLRTHGGRLVRMGSPPDAGPSPGDGPSTDDRRRAAARGRYGRNAMVQGAAAEFFKTWAVIVRSRLATSGSRIVLALHDELLLEVPEDDVAAAIGALTDGLAEAAHRWLDRGTHVRFVAEATVGTRWSDLA